MTVRPFLRPAAVGVVFVGGAAGTLIRYTLGVLVPVATFPVVTIAINLVGSFLLGALLEGLARRGPDEGGRRLLRLGLGTGVLGGFTTYSTFALDVVTAIESGRPIEAVVIAAVTIVGGVLAAWAGIVVAGRRRDRPVDRTRLAGGADT